MSEDEARDVSCDPFPAEETGADVFELDARVSPASAPVARKITPETLDAALALRTIPEVAHDGSLTLLTTKPDDALAFIARCPDIAPVQKIGVEGATTVFAAITKTFGPDLTAEATGALSAGTPEFSSATGFPWWMKLLYLAIPLLLTLLFLSGASTAAQTVCALILPYVIASTALRLAAFFAAPPEEKSAWSPPDELPRVSILVPVYREPRSMPILVNALSRLDYPKDRLEVLFLLEENDTETSDVLALLRLPDFCAVMIVPDSQPRTKPKAMNYALPFLRGEIVGIFDAEDIPDADQITRAVTALMNSPDEVACAQCSLNHFNYRDNFLTRCAAMEYALWFDFLLTRLSWLRLPVPLGGTSLYVRTSVLRAVGGWDADNVTEDADLGARLARFGYRSILVPSTTQEEATTGAKSWIMQRSRWIKGFMQTWAVHMRQPLRLRRELGWRGWLALNTMLLDGFLAFFAQPFFLLALIVFLASGGSGETLFSTPLGIVTTVVFVSGQLLLLAMAVRAVGARFGWAMALSTPLLWVYWQLGGMAALIAAVQLVTRPQYWAKTEHGISPQARALRQELSCAAPPDSGENAHDTDTPPPRPAAKDRYGQPWLPQGTGGFRAYPHAPARRRL